MNPQFLYLIGALALLLTNLAALGLTVLQLPGNWLIVGCTALAAWLQPDGQRFNVTWETVAVVAGLAVVGEAVELLAGAVVAKKQGASRRAVLLSVFGGVLGSLLGAGAGSVIPVLGTLIGVLAGGAGGAFAGAYIGEAWKGRPEEQAIAVGQAVAIGRVLGMLGKLIIGVVMMLVVAWDSVM